MTPPKAIDTPSPEQLTRGHRQCILRLSHASVRRNSADFKCEPQIEARRADVLNDRV